MGKFISGCIFFIFFGWLIPGGVAQKLTPIKINISNASAYRDSLKLKIFGTTVFPYNILPDAVFTNVDSIDHFNYNGFPYTSIMYPSGNLDSIDKFHITLDANPVYFPDKVKAYLFHPHNSNGKLFIYHAGHCAGAASAEDVIINNKNVFPGLVIPTLIAQGYTVLAVPMLNYKTTTQLGVYCGYDGHNDLFTDNVYSFPLRFFFKPLIASLNLLGRNNYSAIYMSGLSGGGWVTSVYPAIDTSITMSFPVAGSWPMPVRFAFYPQLGDYEQTYLPVFTELLDYHELYTLACVAPARKMLQVNNRFDPCCFSGSAAHIYYADSVQKALIGTGGLYKFYLDETDTTHSVTAKALQVILRFIANEEGKLLSVPDDSTTNGMEYYYNIKNNFRTESGTQPATLKFSLLRSPSWLNLDAFSGQLEGMVPSGLVIAHPDTISFKVEDLSGRFVVYNYQLIRKRESPYIFTNAGEDSVLYMLPPFPYSLASISNNIAASFHFSDQALQATEVSVFNNSVIKIRVNRILQETDSLSYNGFYHPDGIRYINGNKLDNIGLCKINISAVKNNIAVAGMIRFNTSTNKFEFFNGVTWISLNR